MQEQIEKPLFILKIEIGICLPFFKEYLLKSLTQMHMKEIMRKWGLGL